MLKLINKIIIWVVLLAAVSGFSQKIPLKAPHLIFLPGFSGGLSYYSLIPTNSMNLAPGSTGWTVADTLRRVAAVVDIELVRYRWGDHVFSSPKYDVYSSMGYSIFSQLGSIALPSSFPSSFRMNNTPLSGFALNPSIKELYLDHHFVFSYSRRGEIHANLATGLTRLSLYKNGDGVSLLTSNGIGIHLGVGWKTTLFGRKGHRVRFGVDLGYSFRGFDIGEQDELLKLSDGSSGALSPIQSISLNSPDLKVSLEFGERFFSAFTPYRDPFRLGLLNLAAGIGFIDLQPGINIQYDTSGTGLSVPFLGTISQNYDLQIFKYNWPFHFFKQANIDVFSGVGVRYWKSSQRTSLPSGWASQFTDGNNTYTGMKFSPKIIDLYVDHEILYPLGKRLHAKVGGGVGYASMTLYENIKLNKSITASDVTWQLKGGLGYTFQGDGSSLVVLGLNAGYYHQAFDINMDNSSFQPVNSSEIAPITYINLSHPVISLSVGLIFGGKTNDAQKAHQAFVDKKFTSALEIQNDLLKSFPDHHNKEAMLLEKQMIEDTLITHYYRDAHQVLSEGKLQNAFSLLQRGQAPPTTRVEKAVTGMKVKVSDKALETAAEALKQLNYAKAEEMITLALKSDPSCVEVAKVLLARSYIIRATILYQSETYSRSLFWLKRADGLTDRYKMVTAEMREKIGEGRLDDANKGILREDREMVYQSMQDAKSLNPILTDVVDEHLGSLELAMDQIAKQQIGSLKRMALDNLLDDISGLDPENFTPRIGMQGSVLSTYVGPPTRRFLEGDYELWTYPRADGVELWLYLRDGIIEKVDYKR